MRRGGDDTLGFKVSRVRPGLSTVSCQEAVFSEAGRVGFAAAAGLKCLGILR